MVRYTVVVMGLRGKTAADTATPAVAKALGVSFRQLDYWWKAGYISGAYRTGSGYQRLWTLGQLREAADLATASRLRGTNGRADYRTLVTLVRNLRELGLDPLELAGLKP